MNSTSNTDTELKKPLDAEEERFIESGWSHPSALRKNTSAIPLQEEKQEAEQKIYSEPDNPPVKQETGGPDKPTA